MEGGQHEGKHAHTCMHTAPTKLARSLAHRFSSSSRLRRRAARELKPPPVEARRVPRIERCDSVDTSLSAVEATLVSWRARAAASSAAACSASERRRCTLEWRKARCRCFFLALYDDGVRLCGAFFVRVKVDVVSE